jgi:hypothetical protein
MIATGITREEMLVLPDDLANHRDAATGQPFNPDQVKITDAPRMRMSIPTSSSP